MSEQLQPHNAVGSLPGICSFCYKRRNDPIHNLMPLGIHTVTTDEIAIETSRLAPDMAIFNDPDRLEVSNFQVFQIEDESVPEMPDLYLDRSEQELDLHVMPDDDNEQAAMHGIVRHDPTCKCETCVTQLAADYNRPAHIADIAGFANKHLTALEVIQIREEHESFVVNALTKDEHGVDYPDWADRLAAHRADIQRKIEKFRVHDQATMRVRAKKETDEMMKLSPEEIAEYKVSASKTARGIKPKKDNAVALSTPKSIDKELTALIKKRDAARDALSAMGIDKDFIDAQLAPIEDQIVALRKKYTEASAPTVSGAVAPEVASDEPERKSKRERQIDSLIKAGLTKDVAEKMVPRG